MLLTGEYEHSVDSKHRLAIPAGIRQQLEKSGLSPVFYLVPWTNGSIWLWPEVTFERMAGALEQTLLPGEDLLEFDEVTFPLARRAEIDSAGRIRLPEEMLASSGLGPAVVILGMRDHLELRDPEVWAGERQAKLARQPEIILRARRAMAGQRIVRSDQTGPGELGHGS